MTRNTITDITRITIALDITGAIETYLWDELTDGNYWHSVEDIARQLESASCASGSWNSMIYTRDILDLLGFPEWQDDIDQAIGDFCDATGESPEITSLESAVVFAVNWTASNLAHRLRSLDSVAVVTAAIDSLDPSPDVIAFADVSEAQDWVAEEVERRVQHEVDHSPYPVTEANRTAMMQVEFTLFTITEESI
tara:strand:- start:513 stop:1097 length:585 start_codon:yes stop_codon:yes gene_type:complete